METTMSVIQADWWTSEACLDSRSIRRERNTSISSSRHERALIESHTRSGISFAVQSSTEESYSAARKNNQNVDCC